MDMLAGIFGVAAQVAALYLLADFASGVFRRAEDRLGSGKAPFRGPVFAAPNALHHREPPAMIDLPWWRNNRDIMIAAVSVVMLFRLAGALTWQVLVCAAAGGFARQAHCLAQTPAARLPRPARWFQRGSQGRRRGNRGPGRRGCRQWGQRGEI